MKPVISGAHVIIYSLDADADRLFFRDVLGLDSVDSGGGWLVFALPPTEVAIHPTEEEDHHELYLLCEDIEASAAELETKRGATQAPIRRGPLGSRDRDHPARRRTDRPLPTKTSTRSREDRSPLESNQLAD
jgi:catechol 2,3-dioxygenase-like lactoylglutathione lyase family enzyme